MTNLTPIEGGKKDPKSKLGTTGGLDDGRWALRFVSIMVLGFIPGIVGLVLATWTEDWWWFLLGSVFIGGLLGLIAVLVTLSFVDLWNEAWREEK